MLPTGATAPRTEDGLTPSRASRVARAAEGRVVHFRRSHSISIMTPAEEIHALLAEPITDAQQREAATFANQLSTCHSNIVLFGAGMLGRKVLSALAQIGIRPVAIADNNIQLHGTEIGSVSITSPSAAAERWGSTALFIVTIYRSTGDGGMADRIRFLKELGCSHVTTFVQLGWTCEHILPHFAAERPSRILLHRDALMRVEDLWADDISREVFYEQLTWRLGGDFSRLRSPAPDQYFPRDILRPHDAEVFIDCGAFDGDTLRSIPWPIKKAWALEPDPQTAAILRKSARENVQVVEIAVGQTKSKVRFNAVGTLGSARAEDGSIEVNVFALDDLLGDESPTFIKLDVEGDELAALEGARNTLVRIQPVVAVCVYHRPDDLWQIPLYLHTQLPDHRLFLRSHANDGFELVTYAIPSERWVGK